MLFKRVKKIWASIPKILKNKYVVTLSLFAIWMLFFDDTSIVVQRDLSNVEQSLEQRKVFYESQIAEIELARQTLEADPERYARERFYMKRADEDIFIISTEK